ncbi:MAG: YeeE/YedE family protein [Campylobacterota bacterium]
MYKNQSFLGLGLLALVIVLGAMNLASMELFYRLLIGLGFGYALARASMGFAGSVNRLSRTGSSTLASALLIMFVITAVFTAFFIYENEAAYRLNIYPINLGLIAGGLMFGFGMAFTSCCATGSLTDVGSGFSRAFVSIFFLSFGVFLGFSTQATSAFVKESWVSTTRGELFQGGVFLPDLFLFDGVNGYLGAIMVTALLATLVIMAARKYEQYYNEKNHIVLEKQEQKSVTTYEKIFVQPWNMRVSVVIIALLFASLLWLYEKGWSASSAFGLWFAKLLMLFGVEAQTLADFTHRPLSLFTTPLLEHGTSIQNFAIILGAILYLLIAGRFKAKFKAGLSITGKDFMLYAFGGFIMGFGTRLSNGCNVGALYTPIAEFSLSGWLYLVVVTTGGFAGNWYVKNYINKSCSI